MRNRRPIAFMASFCLLAALVAPSTLLVSCGQGQAPASPTQGSLSFTTIDFPGATETIPFKLNASGVIAGGYYDGPNTEHAFLWQAGGFTSFDFPGAVGATQGEGINDVAETTGAYDDSNQVTHGFLRQPDGSAVTIDPPTTDYTEAETINNSGTIVGRFGNSPVLQGFLFSNGNYTVIDVPGATNTSAFGINNLGDIVGDYIDASGTTHGFSMSNGTITTIDFPGATDTNAQAINDSGEIVGSTVISDVRHGYRFSNGNFTMIDAPGASLAQSGLPLSGTDVHGINASNEIVGTYQDTSGVIHGFIAK